MCFFARLHCSCNILFFSWNTIIDINESAMALQKLSQIQRGGASIFDVTSPDRDTVTCVRQLVSPSPLAVPHLESRTSGTRQYKMVCTCTSQYVPYSIQGSTRNLKMVPTRSYQHRKFICRYIPVHTSMYRLVPAKYNVVQGGTRWYKMVQGGTNNGIWRYMEVQGRTRII